MKSALFFFVPLLFASTLKAQSVWSMQACIEYALKNNISMKEADLQKRLAALSLSHLTASRWPSLNFSGNSGYRFGLSENPTTGTYQTINFLSAGFSLTTNVALFNWFSKQHTIKASQDDLAAEGMAMERAANDVVLNVQAAYLQALLTKEMIGVATAQIQQTKAQSDVIKKKISAGILSDGDAAQIQLQLLIDSAALLSAKDVNEKSLLQLKAVLALDASISINVEPITLDLVDSEHVAIRTPEKIYTSASANLPQMQQINFQIDGSIWRLKAAKAVRLPTFSLYGSIGSNFVNIPSAQKFVYVPQEATGAKVQVGGVSYEVVAPSYQATSFGVTPFFRQFQTNFGQNIGISLSLPIFNGKTLATALKREDINGQQLALQRDKLLQELKTAIYTAYSEAVAAVQKMKLGEKIVAEAVKVFEAAQKRYNLNLLSTQDLLIAQTNLEKSKTDLVLVKYELLFKLKLLEFYQNGKLG